MLANDMPSLVGMDGERGPARCRTTARRLEAKMGPAP